MGYQIGIDLGTTYTAAAVARGERVEIASLGNRAPTIPSVIFLREDETILTGEAANRRGLSEPERMSREFKRRVGDPTPVMLSGTPYSAESLMAKLLRWVVATVSEQEGGAPERIAVTHPANWGPYKKDLLGQAIRIADVGEATTLTEPEAAAISYASSERVEAGETIAVYDLGGGTFDACVLRKTAGGFEILGTPEGIERLGGIDFDEAVFTHVRRSVGDAIDRLDPDDPAALSGMARLRQECIDAKEALSSDTDVSIAVSLPTIQTEVRLTRAEFEGMIRPTLADTIDALRRALRSAGVEPEALRAVLLVGGSSRIPLVGELVAAELKRPVAVDTHPKHSVAVGAALAAGGLLAEAQSDQVVVEAGTEAARPSTLEPTVTADTAPPPPAPPAAATAPATPAPVTLAGGPSAPPSGAPSRPPAPTTPATSGPGGARGLLRNRAVAVGSVAAVVALAIGAFALLGGGGDDDDGGGGSDAGSDESALVDLEFEIARVELTFSPQSVTFGEGAIYAVGDDLATGEGAIVRIDPNTRDVSEPVLLAAGAQDVVAGAGAVFVANPDDQTIERLDPGTLDIQATFDLSKTPMDLTIGADTLWVATSDLSDDSSLVLDDPEGGILVDMSPETGEIFAEIPVGAAAVGVAFGDGSVWVTDAGESRLVRINPDDGEELADIQLASSPEEVVFGAGGVWVTHESDGIVSHVDPATNEAVAAITVGNDPEGVSFDAEGNPWVVESEGAVLTRISGASGEVDESLDLGGVPVRVTTDGAGHLWITDLVTPGLREVVPPGAAAGNVADAPAGSTLVTLETTIGRIVLLLDPADPQNSQAGIDYFVRLAEEGYYDETRFQHFFALESDVAGVMAGIPEPAGKDDPGQFADDLPADLTYELGDLVFPNDGDLATSGPEFVIGLTPEFAALPPTFLKFGSVISGLEVAQEILELAGDEQAAAVEITKVFVEEVP